MLFFFGFFFVFFFSFFFCLKNANVAVHAHAEIQGSVYLFIFFYINSQLFSVPHYGQPTNFSWGLSEKWDFEKSSFWKLVFRQYATGGPGGGFYHKFYNKFELFDPTVQRF